MNGEMLLAAFGQIEEKYIEEADPEKKPVVFKNDKVLWRRWGTLAACAVVVIGLSLPAFLLYSQYGGQPETPGTEGAGAPERGGMTEGMTGMEQELQTEEYRPAVMEGEVPVEAEEFVQEKETATQDSEAAVTEAQVEDIIIDADAMYLNTIEDMAAGSALWYNSELYQNVVWDRGMMKEYYGRDFTLTYAPGGLSAEIGGEAVYENDGTIVSDTIWIGYYHEEDKYQKPNLSMTASKLGLMGDCIYLLPENTAVTSDVEGTEVTFGYRSMPYGPYDDKTKEPTGYYDLYVAEFTKDEIQYQIVSERMEFEEILKVTASLITGRTEITVN